MSAAHASPQSIADPHATADKAAIKKVLPVPKPTKQVSATLPQTQVADDEPATTERPDSAPVEEVTGLQEQEPAPQYVSSGEESNTGQKRPRSESESDSDSEPESEQDEATAEDEYAKLQAQIAILKAKLAKRKRRQKKKRKKAPLTEKEKEVLKAARKKAEKERQPDAPF